jgi:hypothetical protein
MIKVLVYGETEREAKNFYPLSEDKNVGYRTYDDYGNGEDYDEVVLIDAKKVKVKKAKKDEL